MREVYQALRSSLVWSASRLVLKVCVVSCEGPFPLLSTWSVVLKLEAESESGDGSLLVLVSV